jgi:hypothetical protein
VRVFKLLGKKYFVLGWRDVERAIDAIVPGIRGYAPTKLVAPLRWGLIVAGLLSDRVEIGEVYAIGVKLYKSIDERRERVKIYQPLPISLKGERVLLVDDVSDTGRTLTVVHRILRAKGARELRTATLHTKPWTSFVPDYYFKQLDGWICYPWARHEDASNILKLLESKLGQARAKQLMRRHGIASWL